MRILGVLIFVTLLAPPSVRSQDAGAAGPTVEDLGWMAGRWTGESEGRRFEEHWSAPVHGQMTSWRGPTPIVVSHPRGGQKPDRRPPPNAIGFKAQSFQAPHHR